MAFLADYLTYNKGNECPENYHLWAALSVLSSVVSRRIWIDQGYFVIHANLYICLVGKQGNRKTTAKDIAYDLLREVAPLVPVSAESMSKEAITQFMADDAQIRMFMDDKKNTIEYRPFSIYATELKNFLSINPITLIDFLTTVYDRKFYDVITKNKGTDTIVNPYVVFFACETPEWIIARLKESVISGGFSRRTVFVYEMGEGQRIPFPTISSDANAAWNRVKVHLNKLKSVKGQFVWHPDAITWYGDWYTKLKMPSDPLLEGFYRSKHVQLLKVAMLVALCEEPFDLILRKEHLQFSLVLLDRVEVNLPRLSQGVGSNLLAAPTTKIMDLLIANGGLMPEKDLQQIMFRDMPRGLADFQQILTHLIQTEQVKKAVLKIGGIDRMVYMTVTKYSDLKREGKIN